MSRCFTRRFLAATLLAAAAAGTFAQEGRSDSAKPGDPAIYQQRGADGRIILTDRPVPGAVTQRTWQALPDDSEAALARREAARLDALAVTERIQRQIDAQHRRDTELALARAQLAESEARLAAERARADAAAEPRAVWLPYDTPYWATRPIIRPSVRPPRPLRPETPGIRRPPRPNTPGPIELGVAPG